MLLGRLAVWSIIFFACLSAAAEPDRGEQLAHQRKANDSGWLDSSAQLTMILRNQQGDESVRKLRLMSLEVDGDGDRDLIVFDEPRDIRGAALLSHAHIAGADDQWLYLPALKRVKRIASTNKSGSFMGSEFAYEDLSSFEVDKYAYRFVEETEGAFVVEQSPVDKLSGYSRMLVHLDKEHFQPHQVTFYDRQGRLYKALALSDYRRYRERFWRPHTLEMINHKNGKTTVLQVADYQFQVGLQESDFRVDSLRRVR